MEAILSGLQIILAVVVIVLILLHSGKDAGLSGAFGVGTGAGPFGGGSLDGPIREADAKFADSPGDVQALIVAALAEKYRSDPPPAAFRAIASPLA